MGSVNTQHMRYAFSARPSKPHQDPSKNLHESRFEPNSHKRGGNKTTKLKKYHNFPKKVTHEYLILGH